MITNQAYLFIIFIVDGILIGLLFDLFRISRKVIKTSNFVTYIEDIIFWLLTGFIILYSIFVFNNGELRLYMFLGIILGTIIYMLFISSYIIKINIKIINILKKILKILLTPINFIINLLRRTFKKPITFLFINTRKIFTNFKQKTNNMIKKSKKGIELTKKSRKKKDFRKKSRIYNYE